MNDLKYVDDLNWTWEIVSQLRAAGVTVERFCSFIERR